MPKTADSLTPWSAHFLTHCAASTLAFIHSSDMLFLLSAPVWMCCFACNAPLLTVSAQLFSSHPQTLRLTVTSLESTCLTVMSELGHCTYSLYSILLHHRLYSNLYAYDNFLSLMRSVMIGQVAGHFTHISILSTLHNAWYRACTLYIIGE